METTATDSPLYQRRWLALAFICLSLTVIALDNTILNVAIPSIASQLGADATDIQWIVDAYILVFAALLLTMGSLGDRFGRKRALQAGLALFGVGSLAAGLAQTTEALIAARAFLGIGGAVIMPATLSIISATFPPQERPQAIAIWAAVFGLGVGIGPVIGGLLLERFEWNAVFFVNLPVVIVAIVGGHYFISESKDEHAPPLDLPGVVLSIVGLFALVYGIVEAGAVGWTEPNVLAAFAAAVVFLGAFAWWEARSPNAMLPLELFRNMSFTGANIALALVTFSLLGGVFFLSQYFQSVLGYSPLEAGVRILPQAFMLTIMAALSARISARIGTKITVSVGILVAAIGFFYLAEIIAIDTPYSDIVIGQMIFAAGLGLSMSPATNSIMGSVPLNKAGVGSAMNDTTRQLGGALGIAVLGTIANSAYRRGLEPLIADLRTTLEALPTVSAELADNVIGGIESGIQRAHAIATNPEIPLSSTPFAARVINESSAAFVDGMSTALFIGAIIMVGAAAFTLVVLPTVVRRPSADLLEGDQPASEQPLASPAGD
jgi:EmrB/QacA subfamily drug resistance transporter